MEKPMKTNIMAEKETDSNGFTFVQPSNGNNKACMDPEQYPIRKHEHKMAIQITFYHPPKQVLH